jgi:hypothetical protein
LDDVGYLGSSGPCPVAGRCRLLTQAVWKRFSTPKNCK